MSIEWGNLNYDSDMEMQVRDNTQGETNILDAGLPFSVKRRVSTMEHSSRWL